MSSARMDAILSKRYALCDFSKIYGFPNPVPNRDEWEGFLPRFRGEDWEVPAEHLLNFHECISKLKVVHEDVMIKLFRYSLEGKSRDWCKSLPIVSVSALRGFHAAYHSFCKESYSADLLYERCCYEFDLLTRGSENHEEHVCEGNIAVPESVHHNFQEDFDLQEVSNCFHDVELSPLFEEKDDKQVLELIPIEDLPIYDESKDVFSSIVEHKDQCSIFQQPSIFQVGEDHNVIHVVASV